MRRVALLGYPLEHSVSPAMHNAAFQSLGLAWRYEARPTPPAKLNDAVGILREIRWAGANVTVPFKEDVLPSLDEITPRAAAVGAVNTIVNQKGRLVGENTDLDGFLTDLKAHGRDPANGPAVVLGSGGAARAVVFALGEEAGDIRLICRRAEPGRSIAAAVHERTGAEVHVLPWTKAAFIEIPSHTALIVNATSLGMHPDSAASPWPADVPFPSRAFVYDLVYNPPVTELVSAARAQGMAATTGLGMLVEQGALAFERWTGLPAPREVMRHAAQQTLESNYA
jgi:shikimate dehydrogenase